MDIPTITVNISLVAVSTLCIGAVIVGVIKFSSSFIAERLHKKYEAELENKLETIKITLGNKQYITKTRFDAEFTIYRELSRDFFEMALLCISLFPEGLSYRAADDAVHKKEEDELFANAGKAYMKAQSAFTAL